MLKWLNLARVGSLPTALQLQMFLHQVLQWMSLARVGSRPTVFQQLLLHVSRAYLLHKIANHVMDQSALNTGLAVFRRQQELGREAMVVLQGDDDRWGSRTLQGEMRRPGVVLRERGKERCLFSSAEIAERVDRTPEVAQGVTRSPRRWRRQTTGTSSSAKARRKAPSRGCQEHALQPATNIHSDIKPEARIHPNNGDMRSVKGRKVTHPRSLPGRLILAGHAHGPVQDARTFAPM